MRAGQGADAPAIPNAIARAVNFETTLADMARRSERRAWRVAGAALSMSLLLAGGYYYVLPLKEKVPYLVMADAYTGTSTVARLTGDFGRNSLAASEAINRSNVAHFVLARESYDYTLIRLRDWTTVYTMSAPGVAAGYTSLHSPRNPDSPYNLYGQAHSIRTRILSIQLLGADGGAGARGATVRFQRSLYDNGTGNTLPLDSRIATLAFTYKPNLGMGEIDRIENPLGFQVTSYRVDNDYAPAPALAPVEPASARAVPVNPVAGVGGIVAPDGPPAARVAGGGR